ncbi:MAG: carboxypeptidase-like regulatory domain-containing protein [Spirosomataceae bacterium]
MSRVFQVKLFFFGVLLFISLGGYGQNILTQTVRGKVLDADNNQPLVGATVMVSENISCVTDTNGVFRLEALPIGRYTFRIAQIGYETLLLPELLVEAGKEKIITITLKESAKQLAETVIRAARSILQRSEYYHRANAAFCSYFF